MNEVRISQEYFSQLARKSIPQYMGEVCKIIETIPDAESQKKYIKEHAFQFMRQIWDKLEAYTLGTKITVSFVTPDKNNVG